ncbi:MAG TPA: radical SAM protein [Nitrospiraceae bacterium]|nr:radical SAM protein [Nitrospiraceae bacterium]
MRTLSKLTFIPERFPLSCQWEITCRCNLHCVMCYTDCFNRPDRIRDELFTDEILRIMDELAEAGCLELCLTGGEPLARPDFFEIYTHAKQKGFLVTIFSNGTLITEKIADRLAALPPHRIEISFHGLAEQTFEGITQGIGSFRRCMKAIQLLLERNLCLVLKTTAMTMNKDEILAIKRYVNGLGPVGYKLGEELRPTLEGSDQPGEFALSEPDLQDINRQDPQLWNETCRKDPQPMPPCESGKHSFHIDAYGQLQLCSGNRRQGYDLRLGSFKEGFYRALPTFACDFKADAPAPLIQLSASHA